MEYLRAFDAMQQNYKHSDLGDWMGEHTEIPVICVTAYLALVFYGREFMADKTALNLKPLFTLWNFILSAFSFIGLSYTLPVLVESYTTHGFYYTVCETSTNWYANGPSGFWVGVFCLSKVPEFMDTVFLVFQKKPVIFLHWYHHTTVMLYCWHAYVHAVPPGLWFATMNYFVHSIMYGYYFMMNLSGLTRAIVKPIAKTITTLQLLQMVVGMTAIAAAFYHKDNHPNGCAVDRANSRMGLIMYTSYFILFASLFKKLYLTPKPKKGGKGAKADADDSICSAATAAMDKAKSS
jgi:hypothetical protein